MSQRLGWLTAEEAGRVEAIMARAGLPAALPDDLDPGRMLDLMGYDKKIRSGRLRLVLMRGLGDAVLSEDFDQGALRETLGARPAA